MKSIYKSYHVIEDVFYSVDKIIIICLVSIQKFDKINGFWSSVFGNLKFKELSRQDGLVKYQVEFYKKKSALGSKREEFYAILKNGKKERVWKPSSYLKESALPTGYSFTNRYLNLSYQEGTFGRISLFTPILKKVEYTDSSMKIEGYLFLPRYGDDDISKFKVKLIKFREESVLFEFPLKLTLAQEREIFGLFSVNDFYKFNDVKVLMFETEIALNIISSYCGIFNLVIENSGKTRLIQNYHSSLEKEEKLCTYPINDNDLALFNFYYDDIVTVWRFEIYQMSQSEYLLLNDLEGRERDDTVWLIGEYTVSARDNGIHFYHYMLENHPEINVYYVIEKNSEDRDNLNSSKVVEYGSYQHFEVASRAKVLVFSHMANYLIPKINAITAYKNRYQSYLKVFLQHGVIATTTSMNMMRKEIRQYNLFNVSSDFEKKIITKHLHYNEDDVMVCGLPRWDRLHTEKRTSNTILIIPTYRNDLEQATDENFIESDYFKFWNTLLSNKKFIKYIEENNIKVQFFIHIILSRFIDMFKINSQNISLKNSDNLQDLLLNCGMLVTDYSSVSFDALFQSKPVVYVPFDFEQMISMRGGEQYIDYKKDLPGTICTTVDSTVNEMIVRVESGWIIDDKYKDRRLKFFEYIDNKNSKRVYQSILNKLNKE